MKSLLFKRGAGAEAAVCNFRRQVGYLAIGIGAVLGAVMVYRLMMSWFM